jgi:uncharacterized protein (TIGR00297 family)
MLTHALVGFIAAGAIALAARGARSLTTSGAIAATGMGTLAVTVGWNWGALLILYFLSSTVLSRLARAEKEKRTSAIVAKGGQRDAIQVLANGGVFAAAAGAMLIGPHVRWVALGAGSLAAAAADTWATEIGTLYGGTPRSIRSGRRVPPGTSGGISAIGTVGAVAGATFVSVIARFLGWTPRLAVAVAVGGVAGALIDSVIGATVQSCRWCDACEQETERRTHDCGAETRHLRGVRWLDNDAVNFISNAGGGFLSAVLMRQA